MVPRRKPIGCVFWPIAYFFSLPLLVLVRLPRAAGARRAGALAARAAGAGAAAAVAAGAGIGSRTRQWRGRVSGGPPPVASVLPPVMRVPVRWFVKEPPA